MPLRIVIIVLAVAIGAWAGTHFTGKVKQAGWPPRTGQPYPNLELPDATGKMAKLSDFKGKVILLETVGMNCAACNAFAGGKYAGGFGGTKPQENLESIEHYFKSSTGGLKLLGGDVIFVQLLLYNMDMDGPTAQDAKAWADHFGFTEYSNVYVLAGGDNMVGRDSFNMIPGFQLIDKNFILRSDSTGHTPQDNLYTGLLPMIPKLLRESAAQ